MLNRSRFIRTPLPHMLGFFICLIVLNSVMPPAAHSRVPINGGVLAGFVRDHATGQGIEATVHVGDQIVHTAANGAIPPTTIPFGTRTHTVDVVVNAPGYPVWRYNAVELAQTHPVEMQVDLGVPAVSNAVLPAAATPAAATSAALQQPPDYINVGRTFSSECVYPPTNVQRIDRVPFMVYVRNVLPYEWISSWPDASLDAGAVAAAQFAWSTALIDRKWTRRGYAFDVLDSTCDQVYRDRTAKQQFRSTDAAVARMWGTLLLRNDKLIPTYFRDTDERCERLGGPDCMGQWGSRDRANEGLSGLDILRFYYDPITPTLRLPADRAVVWERSPDVVLSPGTTRTVSVRLLNVGAATWERGGTALRVVDPNNASNTAYRSPFRHSSWLDGTHPAQLSTTSVALGQDDTFRFTIAAPADLPVGTYQLALRWQHRDGTPIPIEAPIVWTITVAPPTTPMVWLPFVS